MPVSNLDITEETIFSGFPYNSGGNYQSGQPASGERRYELHLSQTSGEIELAIIPLATLSELDQEGIGSKLWVFVNGQKLIYDIGYTIDFGDNKILYSNEDFTGHFEVYFFP